MNFCDFCVLLYSKGLCVGGTDSVLRSSARLCYGKWGYRPVRYVRYCHSRELASWAEQEEVIHPITPPHSFWYLRIQRGSAPGSALGVGNWRTAFSLMILSLNTVRCFVWTQEKNVSCTPERTCLRLTLCRIILVAFLADKTNKQIVSATCIIYSTVCGVEGLLVSLLGLCLDTADKTDSYFVSLTF